MPVAVTAFFLKVVAEELGKIIMFGQPLVIGNEKINGVDSVEIVSLEDISPASHVLNIFLVIAQLIPDKLHTVLSQVMDISELTVSWSDPHTTTT